MGCVTCSVTLPPRCAEDRAGTLWDVVGWGRLLPLWLNQAQVCSGDLGPPPLQSSLGPGAEGAAPMPGPQGCHSPFWPTHAGQGRSQLSSLAHLPPFPTSLPPLSDQLGGLSLGPSARRKVISKTKQFRPLRHGVLREGLTRT